MNKHKEIFTKRKNVKEKILKEVEGGRQDI